jgi:putative copper resistance protein D
MSAADGLLVAVRAIHFGATIVLFGETLFAVLASNDTEGEAELRELALSAHSRFLRVAAWAWAAMAISGACWLALVSVQMSGRPLGEALSPSGLATVLGATLFGQAWSVRALLALSLAAVWPVLQANPPPRRRWAWRMSVAMSGGLLAGLAWAGHANVEVGTAGWAHHAADAAHLLGAGAWLGGLAALVALFTRLVRSPTTRAMDACAEVTARFGNWAALSVAVIILTGIVNACYLLPGVRALLETPYGNILLLKLLVFSIMLVIAAANRTRLTVILRADGGDAAARLAAARGLRRNVWVEQALGATVVVLVAALGITSLPMRM